MTIDEMPVLGAVRNPIEWRAAEMLEVDFPDRVVTMLAMPYEQPTDKVIREGRQITEVVSAGAFGSHVEHRKDVRAYRGHNKDATVGRVIAMQDDERGLITEVRVAKTPLGDETLALAADHLIDASVGFAPMEQRWSANRKERRILKAYLDHLAFVGDPAYPNAQVLDVRAAADLGELITEPPPVGSTPNKDLVLARLREVGYPSAL